MPSDHGIAFIVPVNNAISKPDQQITKDPELSELVTKKNCGGPLFMNPQLKQ